MAVSREELLALQKKSMDHERFRSRENNKLLHLHIIKCRCSEFRKPLHLHLLKKTCLAFIRESSVLAQGYSRRAVANGGVPYGVEQPA